MRPGAKSIVITGMCRSGTSSVAGAFERLGTFFGKADDLYGADSSNEGGYYEHKLINAANRRFHLSLGLPSLDTDPMPETWLDRPMSKSLLASFEKLLSSIFQDTPLWGWKDPQVSTLLPYVEEAYRHSECSLNLVLCVRHPFSVAQSQLARQGEPLEQTLGTWLLSTLCSLRESKGMNRGIVIYENLLADPVATLKPIVERFGIEAGASQWSEVQTWIRPDLSHGKPQTETLQRFPSILERTYELCLRIADQPQIWDTAEVDRELDALWTEWSQWRSFFARLPLPEVKMGFSWSRRGERQRVEVPYRPCREWQRISASVKPIPGEPISIYLYPLPAIVWIRRAVWKTGQGEMVAELRAGRYGQLDEQSGFMRVWPFSGYEQLAVLSPPIGGKLELELEFLVETSSTITGLTFQDLSQRAIQ